MATVISLKGTKILVVEDDPELSEVIASQFQIFGFHVAVCGGGAAAWEYLAKNPVHIVISDIRMKQGTGLNLLSQIRQQSHLTPKFFLISGFEDFSLEKIYALGADGFFAKPFAATAMRENLVKTMLTEEERWRVSSHVPTKHVIKKLVPTILSKPPSDLAVGRGGFFIGISPKDLPSVGSHVHFEFTIDDQRPCPKIEGSGVVRWIRTTDSPGIGLEIEALTDSCRSAYAAWLRKFNPLPYIPCG